MMQTKKNHFGIVLVGETGFKIDGFTFLTPQISFHDALSNLWLAHIFQAQSEHEKGLRTIRSISGSSALSDDRFAAFENIITSYQDKHSSENSYMTAVIILPALSKLIRIVSNDRRTQQF
jgi:hypothetical protein